jgi:hypothetical protein
MVLYAHCDNNPQYFVHYYGTITEGETHPPIVRTSNAIRERQIYYRRTDEGINGKWADGRPEIDNYMYEWNGQEYVIIGNR